jgi:hypothetical protein
MSEERITAVAALNDIFENNHPFSFGPSSPFGILCYTEHWICDGEKIDKKLSRKVGTLLTSVWYALHMATELMSDLYYSYLGRFHERAEGVYGESYEDDASEVLKKIMYYDHRFHHEENVSPYMLLRINEMKMSLIDFNEINQKVEDGLGNKYCELWKDFKASLDVINQVWLKYKRTLPPSPLIESSESSVYFSDGGEFADEESSDEPPWKKSKQSETKESMVPIRISERLLNKNK